MALAMLATARRNASTRVGIRRIGLASDDEIRRERQRKKYGRGQRLLKQILRLPDREQAVGRPLASLQPSGSEPLLGRIPDIPFAMGSRLSGTPFVQGAAIVTGERLRSAAARHLLGSSARINWHFEDGRAANNCSSRPGPRSSYDLEPTPVNSYQCFRQLLIAHWT